MERSLLSKLIPAALFLSLSCDSGADKNSTSGIVTDSRVNTRAVISSQIKAPKKDYVDPHSICFEATTLFMSFLRENGGAATPDPQSFGEIIGKLDTCIERVEANVAMNSGQGSWLEILETLKDLTHQLKVSYKNLDPTDIQSIENFKRETRLIFISLKGMEENLYQLEV